MLFHYDCVSNENRLVMYMDDEGNLDEIWVGDRDRLENGELVIGMEDLRAALDLSGYVIYEKGS